MRKGKPLKRQGSFLNVFGAMGRREQYGPFRRIKLG